MEYSSITKTIEQYIARAAGALANTVLTQDHIRLRILLTRLDEQPIFSMNTFDSMNLGKAFDDIMKLTRFYSDQLLKSNTVIEDILTLHDMQIRLEQGGAEIPDTLAECLNSFYIFL